MYIYLHTYIHIYTCISRYTYDEEQITLYQQFGILSCNCGLSNINTNFRAMCFGIQISTCLRHGVKGLCEVRRIDIIK